MSSCGPRSGTARERVVITGRTKGRPHPLSLREIAPALALGTAPVSNNSQWLAARRSVYRLDLLRVCATTARRTSR